MYYLCLPDKTVDCLITAGNTLRFSRKTSPYLLKTIELLTTLIAYGSGNTFLTLKLDST